MQRRAADQGTTRPRAPALFLGLLPQFVPDGQPPLARTLLPAAVVVLPPVWFPAAAPLVDRLGRWRRRPRTTRAVEGGRGAALTVPGLVLVTASRLLRPGHGAAGPATVRECLARVCMRTRVRVNACGGACRPTYRPMGEQEDA